jgi:hypothetical protein
MGVVGVVHGAGILGCAGCIFSTTRLDALHHQQFAEITGLSAAWHRNPKIIEF